MKRKMTKRQLLTELLANDEAEKKAEASYRRLSDRTERLNNKRRKLSAELAQLVWDEQIKNEGSYKFNIEPIIFKSHIFNVNGGGSFHKPNCKIRAANRVS